jgi:hypothetical protein
MVLPIVSVFRFCARRAQKRNTKEENYRSAEGKIADCVSPVSDK